MALLRIKSKAAVIIEWGKVSLPFIRSQTDTKTASITFSNAVNKNFTAGEILYTEGTPATDGYFQVKSLNTVTLNGSGNFNIEVTHHPSATQFGQTKTFLVAGGLMSVNLSYNSLPVITDVIVETDNRTPYVFSLSDFTFSDFDSDTLAEVLIEGSLTGFELDGVPYTGTWISAVDIFNGKLVYHPLDQDAYYEKDNAWKAKDSFGNISVT